MSPPAPLSKAEARSYLTGQLGLRRRRRGGHAAIRATLAALRCIQLDPLDRVGTNPDLVVHARVADARRGDVYALFPGDAFEHFAKERCILPASAFPAYRSHCDSLPWPFRRHPQPTPEVVAAVLAEVRERGPLARRDLTLRGKVFRDAHPWSRDTWHGSQLALEWLWRRCALVVCARAGPGKRYDLPERVLGAAAAAPAPDFARFALRERVEAAGLFALASGPHWSLLDAARRDGLAQRMVDEGVFEEVCIEGSRRRYLAPAGFRAREFPEDDGQMRVLGPLDPLLWDRKLVLQVFGFEYLWEVYKPPAKRRWGYYVCPLLHRGALVGRFEGRREGDRVEVEALWKEPGAAFDEAAWKQALDDLSRFQMKKS